MIEAALKKTALERGKQQEEWREQMTNEMILTPRSLPQTCPLLYSEPYSVPPKSDSLLLV